MCFPLSRGASWTSVHIMKPNGALLRRKRREGGYSISALGRELGIDKSHLSKAERGVGGLSLENLKKISDRLDIPMSKLAPDIADKRAAA